MGQGLQTLFEHYQLLEQSFPLKDIDAKYTNLVTANGNQQFPVQRWFHLKEAFSIDLLEILVRATWYIRSKNWSITIANALTLVSFLVKRCNLNKGRSKEHLFLLQQATTKKLNSEATFLSPRHLLQKRRMIPDEIRWRLTSALSHHLSACFPDFTML